MHKLSAKFIGLTTALALTVVACGDGDITGVDSGDQLTSAEVAAVLASLGSSLSEAGVSAAGAPAWGAPAQAPISINESVDVSIPCVSGNFDVSASLSGSFDSETFVSDITMNVSWEPNACEVTDGTNTFILDGAPRVDLVLDMTTTQDALTMSGTETGGFTFTSSDGRTGSCAIDVTFSIETTASSVDATVTGTICGLSADGFETLGA